MLRSFKVKPLTISSPSLIFSLLAWRHVFLFNIDLNIIIFVFQLLIFFSKWSRFISKSAWYPSVTICYSIGHILALLSIFLINVIHEVFLKFYFASKKYIFLNLFIYFIIDMIIDSVIIYLVHPGYLLGQYQIANSCNKVHFMSH